MKKTFLFLFFLASLFMVQAQDAKPSKEATQNFLLSMMKSVLGKDVNGGNYTLTKQSFSNDFDSYTCTKVTEFGNAVTEVSLIDWAKMDNGFQFFSYGSPDVSKFICFFTNKVQIVHTNIQGRIETKMIDSFGFFVPTEKKESVWKACLRLRELAKQENKDPFQN